MFNPFPRLFESPAITRPRIVSAFAVAVATDALQILLGPFGITFADEVLDVIAMILTWRLLGFHLLLLPTFLLEILPVIDVLPTWTACVGLVVATRKREQTETPPTIPPGPVIDV
jgi:hypothetical protein